MNLEEMAGEVARFEALCLLARATIFFSRAHADNDTLLGDWAEQFGYAFGILGATPDEVTAAIHTAWDCYGPQDWKRVFGV